MTELDGYGRVIERGVVYAPGPVVPPMPAATGRSSLWPAFLKAFLKTYPLCEGCGRKAETGHHIKPFHVAPALELEVSNIAAVCVPCHFVIAHLGDWRLYDPECVAQLRRHRTRVVLRSNTDARW